MCISMEIPTILWLRFNSPSHVTEVLWPRIDIAMKWSFGLILFN